MPRTEGKEESASEDQLEKVYQELSTQQIGDSSFPKPYISQVIKHLKYNRLLKLHMNRTDNFLLHDDQTILLVSALMAGNIHLEELSFPHHQITDIGFEEILRLTRAEIYNDDNQVTMHSLNVSGNEITGATLSETCLNSKYDCSLVAINLSSNPIERAGHDALAEILQTNQRLQHVYLNACQFEVRDMILLLSSLYCDTPNIQTNTSALQSLELDRPILTKLASADDILCDHLHRILPYTSNLLSLSLRYHSIHDFGSILLAQALEGVQCHLISLNLECNRIGVAGAEALASTILKRNMTSLQFLGLSNNLISDDGAIALAEAIRGNQTNLQQLTLKNNTIHSIGLHALAKAIEQTHTLTFLSLFGNHFDNANGKEYYDLINQRIPYIGLSLDITVYVVDGQYMIAEK